MRPLFSALLATLIVLALAGCGNKGPLYLPGPGAQAHVEVRA